MSCLAAFAALSLAVHAQTWHGKREISKADQLGQAVPKHRCGGQFERNRADGGRGVRMVRFSYREIVRSMSDLVHESRLLRLGSSVSVLE